MNNDRNLPGLYGKIPTLGDFVSRRLTPGFIEAWDKWLQRGLSASKEQLGSQWTGIYLSSPIWHFLLSPGVCGTTPWAGVFMPSVDKVGRYFPLTLAAPIGQDRKLFDLFTGAGDWFKQLETLALSVLEDNVDIDGLDRNLKTLGLPHPPELNVEVAHARDDGHQNGHLLFGMTLDAFGQMADAVACIGYQRLTDSRSVFTVWRTPGSASMKPCLRVYDNLPPMDAFSTLLHSHTKTAAPATDTVSPALPADHTHRTNTGRSSNEGHTKDTPHPQWSSFAWTSMGKAKDINEDAYLERPEIGLWAVADGGTVQPSGDLTGKIAIRALEALMATGNLESFIAYATECLRSVNTDLFELSDPKNSSRASGTSIVVMFAVGKRCAVVWAGNSRLYQFRDKVLTRLTQDHAATSGNPDAASAKALGITPEMSCDLLFFEAKAGDLYLLCSDGLIKAVEHQDIEKIMKQGMCRAIAQGLVELALERGAADNATAVVSRIQ